MGRTATAPADRSAASALGSPVSGAASDDPEPAIGAAPYPPSTATMISFGTNGARCGSEARRTTARASGPQPPPLAARPDDRTMMNGWFRPLASLIAPSPSLPSVTVEPSYSVIAAGPFAGAGRAAMLSEPPAGAPPDACWTSVLPGGPSGTAAGTGVDQGRNEAAVRR